MVLPTETIIIAIVFNVSRSFDTDAAPSSYQYDIFYLIWSRVGITDELNIPPHSSEIIRFVTNSTIIPNIF